MAADILLNAPSVPGGKTVSTTEDSGGNQHENIIAEYLDAGGQPVKTSAANPFPVKDEVAENALISLASEDFATQTTLAAILTKLLASIAVTGTFWQATQPVSAATLPLPTGASIAANQQTDAITNTQLRATPVPVSGTVTVDTSLLATAAKQDTGNTSLASILAKIIAAPATEAKQDTIITDILTLLTQTDFDTKTGSLTETAPATDTASSGLNGRLQRIAQRLTSLIALYPTALGAGGGFKVDGSGTALPVSGTVTASVTGSVTANAGTNLNTSLLALESGGNLANILAKLTAAAASFVKLEDVASADGDAGVPAMAIRKANPANLSNTDGDYEMLQMSGGKLWVQAGATQKPSIGATVALAVTALQSMASSATVGWKSVRTSNLATLANDYEVFISLTTAASAPANDKAVYLYVIPWYTTDGGSTWFSSSGGTTTLPTSSDATYTIASPNNFRLLGVLNYTTQSMTLQDTFLLSNCFGNRLPDGFSFCVINFSGAALGTGCVLDISAINDILV